MMKKPGDLMCKPHNPRRIDNCMKNLIRNLSLHFRDIKTVASCCGHGKYPMTIIVEDKYGNHWDLCSNELIPRKKRFYVKDKILKLFVICNIGGGLL